MYDNIMYMTRACIHIHFHSDNECAYLIIIGANRNGLCDSAFIRTALQDITIYYIHSLNFFFFFYF